jgi:hypothetical protein
MNVLIIGHTERNYLPYMEKYVRFFEENGVDYTILCWQREESLRMPDAHEITYTGPVREGISGKIRSYLGFRRFVKEHLAQHDYDRIIVLTTVPAVFLKGILLGKYDGRYLLDIRDYSFEKIGPYRRIVNRLIDHSALTTISSKGFYSFLEENEKIAMNHNISADIPNAETVDLKEKQVVNIGFIGGVRYYDENVFLIEKLKNAFRYQLWYIGQPTPDCDLAGYCREHGVENVSFVGKYDNAQKAELYKSVDLINSIYGDDSLEVTTALPNRLYEAALLKKPILSSKGTYLGKVIERFDLGLVVDVEFDDVQQMIDDYIDQFDPLRFLEGCERFLRVIRDDEEELRRKLEEFIKA